MAITNDKGLLSGPNIEFPENANIQLVESADDGNSWFKVIWKDNKGNPYTGKIATRLITFNKDEIEEFNIQTDSNSKPLFRGLNVEYIGPSNPHVTNGEQLCVQDLWYDGDYLECRCIHIRNSRPNTDGRVVVKCNLLKRI